MSQSYSLHGYQPIVVDEDCLTDEDCRESLLEDLYSTSRDEDGHDWRSQLTPDEVAGFEAEMAALRMQEKKSPFITNGESSAIMEKEYQMTQLGRLRGYARRKYAGGRSVWFGDGVPPWHRPTG